MLAAGGARYEDRLPDEEVEAFEAVNLLVELGADVNAVNKAGQTALHGAANQGFSTVVQFLVEKGANLNTKDRGGYTPLAIAAGRAPRGGDPALTR